MNASTKTRTALRAALKQEDAAITERLREDVQAAVGELREKVQQPAAVATAPEVGTQEATAAQAENTQPAKVAKMKTVKAKVVTAKTAKAKELVPAAAGRPAARSRSGKPVPKVKPAEAVVAAPATAEPTAPTKGKVTKRAGAGRASATVPAEIAAKKAPVKAAPVKSVAVKVSDAKKEKPEKVVRDSFSMPASEHRHIKALRERLGKTGRLSSKSEVLRAGLFLLGERSDEELVALLDGLPAVAKGKRSKKH
ncbi:hypothetical protein [Aromatoleum evansii]|uniref:hypothetical protein n=1 Tax=Aromatoleum evansii TaxID=59406 RepID=UPI001B7CE1F0|nr:hypothetical protein [Aromatoleum evansii]